MGDHDTLAEYAQHLRRRGLRSIDKTCGVYLRAVVDELGDPAQLATIDVERWLDARRGRDGGPITPATRRVWVSTMRGWGRWLVETGRLERDPFARLVIPRVRANLPRPVADADTAVALNLAGGWIGTAVALMAYLGLRCGEVARLCWRDLDESTTAGPVAYVEGKGGKVRMVPVPAELVARLPGRGRPGDPVVGRDVTPVKVSRDIGRYLRSLGIDATAHALRHTYATHTYAATGDLLAVQKLLGHSSPATTQVYVRVDAERLVAAVAHLTYS